MRESKKDHYIILELERFRMIDGPAEHSVCLIWRGSDKGICT